MTGFYELHRDEHCTHQNQDWCDCDWCRYIRSSAGRLELDAENCDRDDCADDCDDI